MSDDLPDQIEYEDQKPLDQELIAVLRAAADPERLLFCAAPGKASALMKPNFETAKIPYQWVRRLVLRGYIAQEISSRNKVAPMGWIQYVITEDGRKAIA